MSIEELHQVLHRMETREFWIPIFSHIHQCCRRPFCDNYCPTVREGSLNALAKSLARRQTEIDGGQRVGRVQRP